MCSCCEAFSGVLRPNGTCGGQETTPLVCTGINTVISVDHVYTVSGVISDVWLRHGVIEWPSRGIGRCEVLYGRHGVLGSDGRYPLVFQDNFPSMSQVSGTFN